MNNKNNHGFEIINCDFCNSSDFSEIMSSKDYYNQIPGEYHIVKCNNCGLIYTNPRPTKQNIAEYYPDNAGYYEPKAANFNNFRNRIIYRIYREYMNYPGRKNFFVKILLLPVFLWIYRDIKISGIPKFKKHGNLLDVGCSYGSFLYKMKYLGWSVSGLEFNKKAADYGRNYLKLNIKNADFDFFETNEKYDVITLRMVLEHVFSPKDTLLKVYKLLNNNGQIIFSIPDFNGFESKLYKNYAYTLQLPTHLTHFTPETIKKYLSSIGFANIKIYHQKSDRDFIAPLSYKKRDGASNNISENILHNKIIRKTAIRLFINFMSLIGKTSRMTIYAEKK